MALYPDVFELEMMDREKKAREAVEAKKKEEFIQKWVSASPEQQAEILWEIFLLASVPCPIPLEHMMF